MLLEVFLGLFTGVSGCILGACFDWSSDHRRLPDDMSLHHVLESLFVYSNVAERNDCFCLRESKRASATSLFASTLWSVTAIQVGRRCLCKSVCT